MKIYPYEWKKVNFLTNQRYASLFFAIGMDDDENEMICLAFIHRIVEALDRYFGNVCELDVIFNFERVHVIVDEILMAGQIQESSLKEIQKVCFRFNYVFGDWLSLFYSPSMVRTRPSKDDLGKGSGKFACYTR